MSDLGGKLRVNSRILETSYIELICVDQITKEKGFSRSHLSMPRKGEIRAIHIAVVGHIRCRFLPTNWPAITIARAIKNINEPITLACGECHERWIHRQTSGTSSSA